MRLLRLLWLLSAVRSMSDSPDYLLQLWQQVRWIDFTHCLCQNGRIMSSLAGILPPLLTRQEVAQLLRCTPQTVSSLTRAGKLPAPKQAGKRLLYDTRAIVEYISKSENPEGNFPP